MSETLNDPCFIKKYLDKLYDLLYEAYYSTPPYISSKSLIYRALELTRSMRISVANLCREK